MRHDQTNWLIHFVRDRDIDQDYPVTTEEEFESLVGGELEPDASAFGVLLNILKVGLKPYFSFRGGKTTIYGGYPAICATEMPIYSFAQYVKDRRNTKKVSAYGVAILKNEFFQAGGRPVIYGLSESSVNFEHNYYNYRVIDQSVISINEQYRYVAYNPSGDRWIDWSHEREWRWKETSDRRATVCYKDHNFCMTESPGLPLFLDPNSGGFFSKVAIIVWSNEEAERIREILTGYYLAQSNDYGIEFSQNVISNSNIIVLENVIDAVEKQKHINSQTIEGLNAANLLEPVMLHTNLNNYKQAVDDAFKLATNVGLQASLTYKAGNHNHGLCGFASVITFDVTSPEVQYMLANGYASGPYDGMVRLNIARQWEFSQCIDYKEFICAKMRDSLRQSFPNISFYVDARLD